MGTLRPTKTVYSLQGRKAWYKSDGNLKLATTNLARRAFITTNNSLWAACLLVRWTQIALSLDFRKPLKTRAKTKITEKLWSKLLLIGNKRKTFSTACFHLLLEKYKLKALNQSFMDDKFKTFLDDRPGQLTRQSACQSNSRQTVKSSSEPVTRAAKQTDSAALRQHAGWAELLCAAGPFHFRGSPVVYFSLEGGFGCYQVVAAHYQTRVWLVNRQLAALQAPHSVRRGRAEQSGVVTLIPPLSLPDSPR